MDTAKLRVRAILFACLFGLQREGHGAPAAVTSLPTFNKTIAPIVLANCATCHRPGESGPFNLLTYDEVRKKARQVVEVTKIRAMPPWLPEPGHGNFFRERRLSQSQIDLIEQWFQAGTPEGRPEDLPPAPKWSQGWQLGQPDLILTLPKPYLLPADGKDIYRNFVIPVPLKQKRFVEAVEIRPQSKALHHAFVRIDRTRQSRLLDEQSPEPGFDGMGTPATAKMPSGYFVSWQPGRTPLRYPRGLTWPLEPETDLVLQLHMNPLGHEEPVQPLIGIYLSPDAPTNSLYKLGLGSFAIDIPAGATNYLIHDSYTLPIDVDVIAALPHTHYLGRRLEGTAVLPDGRREPLLLIKNWDFNWQGDYRYASPVFLPKGTVVEMDYTFDNSTNNLRNPSHPPRRVRYGVQSTDEMAEFWLQLLPRQSGEIAILQGDFQKKALEKALSRQQSQILENPDDAETQSLLGQNLLTLGRQAEAESHLLKALALGESSGSAHYNYGLILRMRGQLQDARKEFEAGLRQNPADFMAHGNLGLVCIGLGDFGVAEEHLRRAIWINPHDDIARNTLDSLLKAMSQQQPKP